MCVAAIAWDTHPRWRLVAIGNRDEFHARPTASLAHWDNGVIAGRDLAAGGTWLGVSETGHFALVTNYRVDGYPRPELASRGGLVTGWLTAQTLGETAGMNPFNLFTAGPDGARFHTNHPRPLTEPLPGGIHGLSNGAFSRPWRKTRRLEAALADWLAAGGHEPEPLFTALADRTLAPAPLPPDGPAPEFSGVFIANPAYGTRCSTLVMIDRGGNGMIGERRFDADGNITGETTIRFRWPD